MYCYMDTKAARNEKPYFAKKPMGKDKIHELQLDSAKRMDEVFSTRARLEAFHDPGNGERSNGSVAKINESG